MPKGRSFFFLLVFVCFWGLPGAFLGAQEEDDEGDLPIDSDWSGPMPSLYAKGDQTFVITLGFILPSVFVGEKSGVHWFFDSHVNLGGTGSLGYNYFLSPHFFVGGELGGMFAGTLGKSMYYAIPIGLRGGYQMVLGRIELPFSLTLGIAPQKYREQWYLGMLLKGGASAFWRFNNDWSFGINAFWWWLPQWTKNSSENVHGNFLELTLSARYHF